MTIQQAATRLNINHPRQVRNWAAKGRFPGATYIVVNGRAIWDIPEETVRAFVKPRRGPVSGSKRAK